MLVPPIGMLYNVYFDFRIAKSIRLDLYEMIETGAGREDFEQVLGAAAHFMKNFTKGGTTNAT